MKASDRVKKAKINLLIDEPFFGALLLNLQTIETDQVPTMATDSVRLLINPAFVDKLTDVEIKTVLAHEVLHCALLHPFRRGNRDLRKFNVAADFAINNHLDNYCKEAKARGRPEPFKLPEGGLLNHAYDKMSAEEIYAQLPDMPQGGGKGKGKGHGQGQSDPNGPMSDGEFTDAPSNDPAHQQEQEARWKVATTQAASAAKMQGKLPADIARMVDEILNPKTPWQEILRRFITSVASDDYVWSRPNRRYAHTGLILPSLYSQRMGKIAVAIDTSGSIGSVEFNQFMGELNSILFDCKPEKLIAIQCDAKVHSVDEYEPGDVPKMEAHGGGGTSFVPVFDHLENEDIACLIYLTDLYGEFPKHEPAYPVLWAATSDQKVPFGEVVRLEF